jgi:hypothetical protein
VKNIYILTYVNRDTKLVWSAFEKEADAVKEKRFLAKQDFKGLQIEEARYIENTEQQAENPFFKRFEIGGAYEPIKIKDRK